MKRLFLFLLLLCSTGLAQGPTGPMLIPSENRNNVMYVDGVNYTTLASALAACSIPGCVVYDDFSEVFSANPFASLSANTSAEVHLMRRTWVTNASIVVPNKSQLLGSGRGDATSAGTVIQAGASFPDSKPVIQMGASPGPNFAVRIENLTVDCNNKDDAIGVQNLYSEEESGLRHILIVNCPKSGLDIETTAAQNSGPYEDLEVLNQASCTNCAAATVPIVVNNVTAFRGIRGATVNSDGATTPTVGIQIDSAGTFEDIHVEYATSSIVVGSKHSTSAVLISNLECGPNITDCVKISNSHSTQNYVLEGLVSTGTNLLRDQVRGSTLTAMAEGGALAFYSIGNGTTKKAITTSTTLTSRVLNGSSRRSITHRVPGAAGSETTTDPVARGTAFPAQVEYCGATSGVTQVCAKIVESVPLTVFGEVTLNAAATQTITGLPFASASSYSCNGSDLTTAVGVVSFTSYAAASVAIQESGGVDTDHLRYMCVGF